ncbi:MAG: Ig-like domain-containing protein, partial [Acidobacteria bacterium]|nr:Ig-like domain-containing protein [Acidobacteriota bacterium]
MVITPDTESPTVELLAPATTAPGAIVKLVARATDNVGVASVRFEVDGIEVGTDTASPFEATALVPADALPGATITVRARALDTAGNPAETSVTIATTDTRDTTPPTVDVDAPAEAYPGQLIDVTATAGDANGVASVRLSVDGAELATLTAPPYATPYRIAEQASPGTTISIGARATDFAGLTADDATSVRVVAIPQLSRGVITGEVFDDTTGLPLGEASIAIEGTDATGAAYAGQTTSDARGRYALRAAPGLAWLRIQKVGFTTSYRAVEIVAARSVEAIDARLTATRPAVPAASAIGAGLGDDRARLQLFAGATTLQQISLTPLSQQGLAGVLPYGWSPVGAAEVSPAGAAFAGGATLRVINAFQVGSTTPVVVAQWDAVTRVWRTVAEASLDSTTGMLSATIPGTGQFAFLVADTQPVAPPAAVPGQPLQGVAMPVVPESITTTIDPRPQILFYRAGVFSNVRGNLLAPAPMSSGALVVGRIVESYRFFDGDEIHPEPYEADLFFYQVQGSASNSAAHTVVSPSLSFEASTLERGVIGVELIVPGAAAQPAVLGPEGGSIAGQNGEQFVLPVGAVPDATAIDLVTLDTSTLGAPLPQGALLLGGVGLDVAGTLGRSGTLSIATPAGVTDASRVVVTRLDLIGGQTRFVLVGVGRIDGARLVADIAIGGMQTPLDGVRASGRYAFLQIDGPIGFAQGLVRGTTSQPFAGALVTNTSLGIVSLSTSSGAHVGVARAGTSSFTATDLVRNDAGTAPAFMVANTVLPVSLRLVAQPPSVTSTTPTNNAANVGLTDGIVVTFSEPIDPASVAGVNISNVKLAGPDGIRLDGAVALSANNTVLTFRAADPLAENTTYTFTLFAGITDLAGYALTETAIAFASLDTTPPPTPPAGSITASIPDGAGFTTVTATQGTAAPTDRVFIDNITRKTTTVAVIDPNGGFIARIAAGVADVIRVRIIDANGNEVVQQLEAFRQTNSDGSVSQAVGEGGGIVSGPGGVQAKVKPGTFPQGAVVTLRHISPADFPIALTPEQAERFEFDDGVGIDFGGAVPAKYVDLSVAPRGGETPKQRWVLVQFAQDDEGPYYNAVDTARLLEGRIATSSPPCPGVTAAGTYGFVRPRFDQVGTNWSKIWSQAGGMKVDVFNVTGTGIALRLPWNITVEPDRQIACYPSLTNDVTIIQNHVVLTIPGASLTPADRQIVVTNRGLEQSFPRNVPEIVVDAPGKRSDPFRVSYQSTPIGGTSEDERLITFFSVSELTPTMVRIRINPDLLKSHVREIAVTNLSTRAVTRQAVASDDVRLPVTGGVSDTFAVRAIDADGVGRDLGSVAAEPSPYGTGNLVARARPGSIDPTRAELPPELSHMPGRTALYLTRGQGGFPEPILDSEVVNGGFTHAFLGDPDDRLFLTIEYDTRAPFTIELPRFRVVARNTLKGTVVRTIEAFAPPPDEPFNIGDITDDTQSPYVIDGPTRLQSFDPAGTITFTLNEPIDEASADGGIIVQSSSGESLRGRVQVSGGGRVITFYPEGGLRLGETYTVTVTDQVRDRAGNRLQPVTLTIKTFTPRVLSTLRTGQPFKDLALTRKKVNDRVKTTAYVTLGGDASNFMTIDVSDPRAPQSIGLDGSSSQSRQKVVVLTDVEPFAARNGTMVGGNLAITTTFNFKTSFLSFLDVSDPAAPGLLSTKVLTVVPELATPETTLNTIFATGLAKGVTALRTNTGVSAYAAVERVGVMAADLAENIPTRIFTERLREGLYPGDYHDITSHQSTLLALSRERHMALLDPNLSLVSTVPFDSTPYRVRVVENLTFDADNDGFIDPDENYTLALVGLANGLAMVDIRTPVAPQIIGFIPTNGAVRELDADAARRRVFAYVDDATTGPALVMFDLTNPTQRTLVDARADGVDDRIAWRQAFPQGANSLRLEPSRGLLYVSTPSGLEIWAAYDICCDLGVDLEATPSARGVGDTETLMKLERKAIERGIKAGLDEAVGACSLQPQNIRMFESGSSGCLWEDDPVAACNGNYQPGVSDHDISVFFADTMFTGSGTSVVCTLEKLSSQFTDDAGKAKPIVVDGQTIKFEDISFLPNRLSWYQSGVYGLDRTDPNIPGDADNTLGLGHQFLLLKHVTEARWVTVKGWETLRDSVDFDEQLAKARAATWDWVAGRDQRLEAFSPVEGYELANLMEFGLVKGKIYVRVAGAADERSAFNPMLVKQLHDAGKAGIRAAFALMVADPAARERLVAITRKGQPGGLTNLLSPDRPLYAFEANACLALDPDRDPELWAPKRCGSLEEYIASAAARTLRWWGTHEPLTLFTREEVIEQISRFYRVKADLELIETDADANAFLAMVHNFVQRAKAQTKDIYDQTLPTDPREVQRRQNMTFKEERLAYKRGHASLKIVPRVFNRGFTDAPDVEVAMYTASGGGSYQKQTSRRVFLAGGNTEEIEYKRLPSGELERDEEDQPIGVFDVRNIDQGGVTNSLNRVVFTVDLPDRSVAEANRTNNIGGFFWYLLDPAAPTPPLMPPSVPAPFGDEELAELMRPDPDCLEDPRLRLDQTVTYRNASQPNPAFVLVGETATWTLAVTNPNIALVNDATACETMTGQCRALGPVNPLIPQTLEVTVPTATAAIFDVIPTVFSSTTGIQRGPAFRIVVSCERYSLTPVAPVSPSERAVLMQGGTGYRYFRVTDTITGKPPVTPVTVKLSVTGPNAFTKTFTTDGEGMVGTAPPAGQEGATFTPGVSFTFGDGQQPGLHHATVNVDQGGDQFCGGESEFEIDFQAFQYTESLKAGATIAVGIGNPFKKAFAANAGVDVGGGGGFSFTFETERLNTALTDTAFTIGRFISIYANASAELGADVNAQKQRESSGGKKATAVRNKGFVKALSASEAGADVSLTLEALHGDGHRWTLPLSRHAKLTLAAFTLDTVMATNPAGNAARWAINYFNEQLFDITLPKVSENYLARLAFTADAQAKDVEVKFSKRNEETSELRTKGTIKSKDLGVGVRIDAALEWERRFLHTDDKPIEDIVGLRTEGALNWKVPYETNLAGAKADIDASRGSDIGKSVKKAFLTKLQEKLQGLAEGDVSGGVELRLHSDPGKLNDPTKLEIRFLGDLASAYPPVAIDDDNGDGEADGEAEGAIDTVRSLRFTIESRNQIAKLLETLSSARGLMDAAKRAAEGGSLSEAIETGPSVVFEMLLDFVTKVLDYADYDVPTIKGRGIIRNLDISILASAIAKVPVASTLNAQFMQQAAYPLERGQVVGGTQYKLEDYAGAEPGLRDLWSRVKDDIREPVEEAERDRKQKKGPEDDPDEVDTVIT